MLRDVAGNYRGPDAQRIRTMFASISSRYDRANDVLSGGVHRRWRTKAVQWSGAKEGDRVLDCATGTGDLAILFRKAAGASGRVVGTDFVEEMLAIARTKAPEIEFQLADVTALPFENDSFDVASIAFGIRNVSDPAKAIAEMARVVRPGGRVIVLEFGQPPSPIFRKMYDAYRKHAMPRVGGAITGARDAYEYLESSTAQFPCGEEFVKLMREAAAFQEISFVPLTMGIAFLYRGVTAARTPEAPA